MLLVKMLQLNEPIFLCCEDIGVVVKTVTIGDKKYLLLHCKFRHKQVDPSKLKLLHIVSRIFKEIRYITEEIVSAVGNREQAEKVEIVALCDKVCGILLSGAVPLWGLLGLMGVVGYIEPRHGTGLGDYIATWHYGSDVEVTSLSHVYVYDPKQRCFINFRGEKVPVPQELQIELENVLDQKIDEMCFR